MFIATVAGNIGKDAVFKSTAQGTDICSFAVAASVGYGDKEQTLWVDVSKFGKGAEKLSSFLTKGKQVTVSGEVSTREYEGKTYLQMRADHIKMQGGAKSGEMSYNGDPKTNRSGSTGSATADNSGFGGGGFGADDDLGDEVPFLSCNPALERRVT